MIKTLIYVQVLEFSAGLIYFPDMDHNGLSLKRFGQAIISGDSFIS